MVHVGTVLALPLQGYAAAAVGNEGTQVLRRVQLADEAAALHHLEAAQQDLVRIISLSLLTFVSRAVRRPAEVHTSKQQP
ncbi:MAG: hypothetical protein IPM12_00030 [Flavobacteriales bacterium]|nr:hypothetical protein [Flavobacteriales bacterium]